MINSEREGKEIMAHAHALFARDPGDEPMRIPRRGLVQQQPMEEEIMIPPSDEDDGDDEDIMIPPSDEDAEEERDIVDLISDEDEEDDDDKLIAENQEPVILKNGTGRKIFKVFPRRLLEENSHRASPAVLAAHFRANGYIFVRDALSHDLRDDLQNLVSSPDLRKQFGKYRPATTTSVLTGEEQDATGRPPLPDFKGKYSARLSRVLRDERLSQLLDSLVQGLSLDTTMREWSLHFRARTFKTHTGVHADWLYYTQIESVDEANDPQRDPRRIRPFLTVWLPLTPCNGQTGGLVVSPMSHVDYIASRTKFYPDSFDPATAPWASANYNIGDVLVFEGRMVHAGATNNNKDGMRFSLDFRFLPTSFKNVDFE